MDFGTFAMVIATLILAFFTGLMARYTKELAYYTKKTLVEMRKERKREGAKILIANFIDSIIDRVRSYLGEIEKFLNPKDPVVVISPDVIIPIPIEEYEKYLEDFKMIYNKAKDIIKQIEYINKEIGYRIEFKDKNWDKIKKIRDELNKLNNMLNIAREKLMKEYDIMEYEIDKLKPKIGKLL